MNTARFSIILFFFAAAFLCCAVKGCLLAGPHRAGILAKGEKIARVWRRMPAKRGRILDRQGKVLVWSELYCDLHYNGAPYNSAILTVYIHMRDAGFKFAQRKLIG